MNQHFEKYSPVEYQGGNISGRVKYHNWNLTGDVLLYTYFFYKLGFQEASAAQISEHLSSN